MVIAKSRAIPVRASKSSRDGNENLAVQTHWYGVCLDVMIMSLRLLYPAEFVSSFWSFIVRLFEFAMCCANMIRVDGTINICSDDSGDYVSFPVRVRRL